MLNDIALMLEIICIGYLIIFVIQKLKSKQVKIKKTYGLVKYPQQLTNIELILESRQLNNKIMYITIDEFIEYLKYPINNIKVEKRSDKLFFSVKNYELKGYTHKIIFRNSYMILLKIILDKEVKYTLIWREVK